MVCLHALMPLVSQQEGHQACKNFCLKHLGILSQWLM